MLFNSLTFGVFLPIVFIIYWLVPHKYRWFILLVSSYYFYMSWNVKYVVLILLTTAVSYTAAILIEKAKESKAKKAYLAGTLLVSLGILFIFKYFNFFTGSLSAICQRFAIPLHPVTLKLLLPVGISFYTFQTLSYVIDVYKGRVSAEHHFGIYATFISFFPQLVAGPIERTENLLPQIKAEHRFDYSKAAYGLKLMAWGYFKKLAIADVLAAYVDTVYDSPYNMKGFAFVIATLFFTIQIYCDFSGYSDIAIGTAKLLGIDLMTNFRSPYFSASIKEFWSRWHISLSTWFRDYVYIPLGGNRVGKLRNSFNLMVTFLVSGLWHGANWTYVLWGGIHGAAQVLEKRFNIKKPKNFGIWLVRVLAVFIFCNIAWIFFRANDISDAFYIIAHAFDGIKEPVGYLKQGFANAGVTKEALFKIVFSVAVLFTFDYFSLSRDVIAEISKKNKFIRYFTYFAIITLILCLRASSEAVFVYFQF